MARRPLQILRAYVAAGSVAGAALGILAGFSRGQTGSQLLVSVVLGAVYCGLAFGVVTGVRLVWIRR